MPTNQELNEWMAAVAGIADRTAFAALFKHFAPRLKGYLMHSGSSAELAEELAQETMVTLWRKAQGFDPARAQLSTWVFAVARNLRIDHHRRAASRPAPRAHDSDGDWDADQQPADAREEPEACLSLLQRERILGRALAELPPDQSLVLRLSFFEEHPHARIAEELRIPLGTVKSRIRIAVAELRRKLDNSLS